MRQWRFPLFHLYRTGPESPGFQAGTKGHLS
jgi:hypothetical protein